MSQQLSTPDDKINVAAVCGTQVRIYDTPNPYTGVRRFLWKKEFANHGQALQFADEYEQGQRGTVTRRAPRG